MITLRFVCPHPDGVLKNIISKKRQSIFVCNVMSLHKKMFSEKSAAWILFLPRAAQSSQKNQKRLLVAGTWSPGILIHDDFDFLLRHGGKCCKHEKSKCQQPKTRPTRRGSGGPVNLQVHAIRQELA
jgi:hypothetical protein